MRNLSSHEENVLTFLKSNVTFRVDGKGRKYYSVPTCIRRNGKMIVSDSLINKLKKLL